MENRVSRGQSAVDGADFEYSRVGRPQLVGDGETKEGVIGKIPAIDEDRVDGKLAEAETGFRLRQVVFEPGRGAGDLVEAGAGGWSIADWEG